MTKRYGSDIPLARTTLKALAAQLRRPNPDLRGIAGSIDWVVEKMMHRSMPKKPRAAPQSTRVPPEEIRAWCRAYPEASNMDVAIALGTNPGRVSEALHHVGEEVDDD